MMNKPDYLAPTSLEEALQTLKQQTEGTQIIAGGTDLVPRMRSRVVEPDLLLDLRLLNLDSIEMTADGIRIGACATHTDILESDLLAKNCPAMCEAAADIAGPPIRNRGTVGGNLVNASPAADLAPPLLAYDARVVLAKAKSKREIPLVEFFTGPGQTLLTADEILTEILVPPVPPRTADKFIKLGKRKAMAVAVVSVAARLTLDEAGLISQARIALGSVAPTPMLAKKAEAALQGQLPSLELFKDAGQIAMGESAPITDIRASGDYRKKMVAVLTRRALEAAWQQLIG
ncbi:MAG: xanthine dehydrogenase family protein subunit M [Anaerolineales bacterium]|nr:xanthine dehydrogenase family protein subunit M [Anaerolineales bacterium]